MNFRLTHIILRQIGIAAAMAGMAIPAAQAQQNDWWFEVEVILFKRNLDPASVSESFTSDLTRLNTSGALDLLTPYLQPDNTLLYDSLASCDAAPDPIWLTLPPPEPIQSDETDLQTDTDGAPEQLADEVFNNEDTIETGETTVDQPDLDAQISSFQTASDTTPREPKDPNEAFASDNVLPHPSKNRSELDTTDAGYGLQNDLDEAQQKALTLTQMLIDWQPQDVSLPKGLHCQFFPATPLLYTPLENIEQPQHTLMQVPVRIDGTEWAYSRKPYLLAAASLQLNELARDIGRRKGLSILTHVGWRQEVAFGRDKAFPVRVFSGQNYASRFRADGTLRPVDAPESLPIDVLDEDAMAEPVDVIAKIREALSTPDWQPSDGQDLQEIATDEDIQPSPMWELDGTLKVFLRYINRVPYLHIDSNMDFRAPVLERTDQTPDAEFEEQLQSYRFEQLRRVISTQMHYFDHPMFGMVVQIRRFYPPEEPEQELPPEVNEAS